MPATATEKRQKNGNAGTRAKQKSRAVRRVGLTLDSIDGRTFAGRRFSGVYAAIVSDLGGEDHLSEGQKQLAWRAARLAIECEMMDAAAIKSGTPMAPETLQSYGQLVDRFGRAMERLGLERRARDVTPSLSSYLAMEPDERAKVGRS